MNLIRTFIAIEIPVGQTLSEVWDDLRSKFDSNQVKWVGSSALHLTLIFLGDTPVDKIDGLAFDLKKVLLNQEQFEVELKGIGFFGSHQSPRVIWVGVERSAQLSRLKVDVTRVMLNHGFTDDQKAFNPHITLGRVKHLQDPSRLMQAIGGYGDFHFQKTAVNSIIHFKSDLKPAGPIYTPISTVQFK